MKFYILTLSLFCSLRIYSQMPDCAITDTSIIFIMGGEGCLERSNYTPDQTNMFQNTPLLVIDINMHFLRPEDGSGFYSGVTMDSINTYINDLNHFTVTYCHPNCH